MTPRLLLPAFLAPALLLAACRTPADPSGHASAVARSNTADELMPSGKPYDGPRGPVSSVPPADNNANRLRCHPEGLGIRCDRDPG